MKFSDYILTESHYSEIDFTYPKQRSGYNGFIIQNPHEKSNEEIANRIATEIWKIVEKRGEPSFNEIFKGLLKALNTDRAKYFSNRNQLLALVNRFIPGVLNSFTDIKIRGDILNEAKVQKIKPATPGELAGISQEDCKNVDIKYIESKIDWDDVDGSFDVGTPQEQGRYNDTVISGTVRVGKDTEWELKFVVRGDAKVSRGWDSVAKFKGLPSPEYIELGELDHYNSKFILSDGFVKMIKKHESKILKTLGYK